VRSARDRQQPSSNPPGNWFMRACSVLYLHKAVVRGAIVEVGILTVV